MVVLLPQIYSSSLSNKRNAKCQTEPCREKKTWHFKNRNKTGREKLYGTVQSDETVQVTYYFKD